jgi:hypothetical protein
VEDDQLTALDQRYYTLWRERIGATGNFDYRLGENSTLALTGIYTDLGDEEQRQRMTNGVEDGELLFLHKNRLERAKTWNVSLGGDHLLRSGLGVDYHVTLSRSIQDTPYDNEIEFVQEGVEFTPDISDPENVQANPAGGAVGGTYLFNGFEPATSYSSNLDHVAALSLTLPYALGRSATGTLKFGAKYRDKHKWQDFVSDESELADGADDIVLGEDVGVPFEVDNYEAGDYQFPLFATTPDEVRNFGTDFSSSLETGTILEDQTQDFTVDEEVVAAYLMSEIQITPALMVLPGIRYEHTKTEQSGFAFDPEAETLTPQAGDKSYGRLFPASMCGTASPRRPISGPRSPPRWLGRTS